MSLFDPDPNGLGPIIRRVSEKQEKDGGGFIRQAATLEQYDQPEWFNTELPESMRLGRIGHDGAEPFLTREFIRALLEEREPAVNLYEALAMTVPAIVAHQSAIEGGKQMKVPGFDPKA